MAFVLSPEQRLIYDAIRAACNQRGHAKYHEIRHRVPPDLIPWGPDGVTKLCRFIDELIDAGLVRRVPVSVPRRNGIRRFGYALANRSPKPCFV